MIDVKKLLEKMKASPFEMVDVLAAHTGVFRFELAPGAKVSGPQGSWKEKPGTRLGTIERERNVKPVNAPLKGVVETVAEDLSGKFVEAGTVLYTIRHYLTKAEVEEAILKQALSVFAAPERARYYFTPEVDKKVKASGERSVKVRDGMELFIVSRMKRETPLAYSGPSGIIYSVFFSFERNVDQGQPLIGVCPEEQMPLIREVVNKVQAEWEEQD